MSYHKDNHWGACDEFESTSAPVDTNRAWPYLVPKGYLDKLINSNHHLAPLNCRLQLTELDKKTEHKQPGPLSTERDFFEPEIQYTLDLIHYTSQLKRQIQAMKRGGSPTDAPEAPVKKPKSDSGRCGSTTSGIVDSSTKYGMLRKVCSASIMLAGFTEVEQVALNVLVDVTDSYLSNFCRCIKNAVDYASSTGATNDDQFTKCLESVFADFGLTRAGQLLNWYPNHVVRTRDRLCSTADSLLQEHAHVRSVAIETEQFSGPGPSKRRRVIQYQSAPDEVPTSVFENPCELDVASLTSFTPEYFDISPTAITTHLDISVSDVSDSDT